MKKVMCIIAILSMFSCSGSFNSTVTPGYNAPKGDQISITFLDHPDVSVSNSATKVLENQLLKTCNLFNFKSSEITNDKLEENNINIPRRLSKKFIKSLLPILKTKYLFTGGVTKWQKGSVGFPVASATEVAISLTLHDLETGNVVWTVSGDETGGAGIFAQGPESKAKVVIKTMLKKWKSFCK